MSGTSKLRKADLGKLALLNAVVLGTVAQGLSTRLASGTSLTLSKSDPSPRALEPDFLTKDRETTIS